MITVTPRDRVVIWAGLHQIPVLPERGLALLWPDNESGRENMGRRIWQLCEERLLERHVAHAQAADGVSLFDHWAPGLPTPELGPHAWALSKRWAALEPRRVVFYTATEAAAKHYGRTIRSPLRSASALAHNIGLGQVFFLYAVHQPLLASAWVAEEVIAASRGYGEKVVDACIVDSNTTPALAIEFAGASYAASNGERLREIHRDCEARQLPYEMWTVSDGETP